MTLLSRVRSALRLETPRLRRAFSASIIVTATALTVLTAFVREISVEAAVSVGVVSTLFFVVLLVDYVATLQSSNEIVIFANEDEATDAQLQYIRSRPPKRVRMCEYSGYAVGALFTELGK